MNVALLFDHFGPYHQARLRGLLDRSIGVGVEFYSRSRDYAWEPESHESLPMRTVMKTPKDSESRQTFPIRLAATLQGLRPDAVAVPGWSSFEALTTMRWCLDHNVPAILMSESSAHDAERSTVKEWIKKQIVGCFSAALVGGTPHVDYLKKLGFPADGIFTGYDAVDHEYFVKRTDDARRHPPERSFFLASNRFIEKKNLFRLLEAYAAYRHECAQSGTDGAPWDLRLLGDGELRPALEKQIEELQLRNHVEMPGFKQYDELPDHYASASAFIHASTTEQWGLVVNEAMASALPVLVSERCGCATDLVIEGENGFTFDPFDTGEMTRAMLAVHRLSADDRRAMGMRGRTHIENWGPDRFGKGLAEAATYAMGHRSRTSTTLARLLLGCLTLR